MDILKYILNGFLFSGAVFALVYLVNILSRKLEEWFGINEMYTFGFFVLAAFVAFVSWVTERAIIGTP